MAKTQKKKLNKQPKRALTNAQLIEIPGVDKEISNALAEMQVSSSLKMPPGSSAEDRDALKTAAVARYREFAPADATERLLASLSIGLHNAAMTSLEHAVGMDMLLARTEELKNATKAAVAAADLLEALDRRRGRGSRTVAVGQVTVETGGQAIVGNVNSEISRSTKPEEMQDQSGDPSPQEKK
jgi:hypothetical protein